MMTTIISKSICKILVNFVSNLISIDFTAGKLNDTFIYTERSLIAHPNK